jgi:hypothetical protein
MLGRDLEGPGRDGRLEDDEQLSPPLRDRVWAEWERFILRTFTLSVLVHAKAALSQ